MSALALRVAYLGQRWVVLEHQLMNGALLLFAFFMISDPMTSPNHPRARAIHAGLVAAIAFTWQFGFYAHNGMLWALFLAAPMVPMWDVLWAAPKYRWTNSGGGHESGKAEATGSDTHNAGSVRDRAAA
jgi:Na+-translocating ferredoxin:NAD+ oxidoreductase RnfD subunit